MWSEGPKGWKKGKTSNTCRHVLKIYLNKDIFITSVCKLAGVNMKELVWLKCGRGSITLASSNLQQRKKERQKIPVCWVGQSQWQCVCGLPAEWPHRSTANYNVAWLYKHNVAAFCQSVEPIKCTHQSWQVDAPSNKSSWPKVCLLTEAKKSNASHPSTQHVLP